MLRFLNVFFEEHSRKRKFFSGAIDSASSFLLSELQKKTDRKIVIITTTLRKGYELYENFSFFSNRTISLFPHWGTLPYRAVTLVQELMSERISVLSALSTGNIPDILIVPVRAFIQKVLHPEKLKKYIMDVQSGTKIELHEFVQFLDLSGYTRTPVTEHTGEYSVHGGIIDLFSPSSSKPVRIELDGDVVYSMRLFDPETQRKIDEIQGFKIIPPSEIIFNSENIPRGVEKLKEETGKRGILKQKRKMLEEKFLKNEPFPGRDFYYPYFCELTPFYNYLKEDILIILDNEILCWQELDDFFRETEKIYSIKLHEEELFPQPELLFINPDECKNYLMERSEIIFTNQNITERYDLRTETCDDIRGLISPAKEFPFEDFARMLKNQIEEGWRIFIVMPNELEANRIISILEPYSIPKVVRNEHLLDIIENELTPLKVIILYGSLRKGFKLNEEKIIIIGEWDIFGEKGRRRPFYKIKGLEITDFGMLKEGDLVVHQDYGIGKYCGMKLIERDNTKTEFLIIEYRDGDKLYVPVFRLNLIQKYRGVKEQIPELHKLGTRRWELEKKRVKQSLRELTANLLRLYAKRKLIKGFAYPPADTIYREFELTFPYEETPDQTKAINEVLKDMESESPMERLICGDVGFGKTEVAIRAAFKAIMAGKQVAILVPTTILALQHERTFTERFKNYPIKVESLTRLKKKTEIDKVLQELKEGKVDLIIGTHRLLNDDVVFKDLGLLIIDEEHRFGVFQKEKLKKLRVGIDVISMTATPIPRSLQMSLSGIRDMSLIYTPPPSRQSIRTFVSYFSDDIIRDAIVLEKMRGGQSFYIHNEVQNITKTVDYIKKLVPEAKIKVTHGKMDKKTLEVTMLEFLNKEIDVLVSTSIIASGIDIPQANTIIVENAHRFGLTDLYQLRGRVGRSSETAYAYFLIPEGEPISKDALERLSAIQEYSEVGTGFKLAMRDLEIRGAGELLGAKQSGHISSLGFELYSRLLEETINELSGRELHEEIEPEIKINIDSYIPEDYIPDISTRLQIYKKLAIAKNDKDLGELCEELKDRFGKLPNPLINLIELTRLRNLLSTLRIQTFTYRDRSCSFNISAFRREKIFKLFNALNKERIKYRLEKKDNLLIFLPENYNIFQLNDLLKKILNMIE